MKELVAVTIRELFSLHDSKKTVLESFIGPFFYCVFFIPALSQSIGNILIGDSSIDYFEFTLPGLILFNFFNNAQYAAVNIYIDKTSGEIETLFSLPISRSTVVMSYAISSLIKSIIQMIFLVAIFYIIMGSKAHLAGLDVLLLLAIGVVFGLITSYFYVGMAARVKSQESFNILVNSISIPMLFTSTVFFDNRDFTGYLKWISEINPLSFVSDFARSVIFEEVNLLGWKLIILVVIGLIGFFFARVSINKCLE